MLLSIVDRIKSNDSSAREEFVVFLAPHVKKIATKLAITSSELQSSMDWVLTKIINNVEKLDAQKNVLTYITNSIRNYCIDEYRKVCVRQRKEYQVKQLNSKRNIIPEYSFEFLIEDICKTKEEQIILSRIIFDKESIQDIAKDTNVPVKKIKCLLDRVKTELQQ